MSTIVDAFEGVALGFVNNASVASDGTIYFSDTSSRWHLDEYVNDLLEGIPTGRVFRVATDGTISVVADDLQFANGVALDIEEATLFIAETRRYRVHRLWLKGECAGEIELLLDDLPGGSGQPHFLGREH